MFKRVASTLIAGVAAVVLQGVASAHTLTLFASATCSAGVAVIDYQVQASQAANQVDILFNGKKVDSQSVPDGLLQFSGEQPAPAGNPVTVTAIAKSWVDGFTPGQTSSVIVTVPTDCLAATGRFTGGGKTDVNVIVGIATVNGGDTVTSTGLHVTKGFEIHCDLDHPNSLEVNWTQGHHFHTEVFTSAACSDDPNIKQQPPAAPVDTIHGTGTGRYDGVQGFTIEFTLVDAGEPGTQDESAFKIYETANPANIVLLVPLSFVTSGNIQTHFDNK